MNLYLTADGRYVGTQAEAKKSGKGWTPETVPTDKEGLIDYLNAKLGRLTIDEQNEIMENLPWCEGTADLVDPKPKPTETTGQFKLRKGDEASQIAEFILDDDTPGYAVNNILGAALERLDRYRQLTKLLD